MHILRDGINGNLKAWDNYGYLMNNYNIWDILVIVRVSLDITVFLLFWINLYSNCNIWNNLVIVMIKLDNTVSILFSVHFIWCRWIVIL